MQVCQRQLSFLLVALLPSCRGNTRGGGACILVSAKPPIPREQCSSAPQFWATPIFMPTPQNDQIRLGNTYGEGRVFRRSATPLRRAVCHRQLSFLFFLGLITVVTCFQIQLITVYRRRLVKLSFYLVGSGSVPLPRKKIRNFSPEIPHLVYSE